MGTAVGRDFFEQITKKDYDSVTVTRLGVVVMIIFSVSLAYGFANSVPVANGVLNPASSLARLSLLFGFGPGYKVGKFVDIADVYLGSNNTKSTAGMTYLNAKYTVLKSFTFSIWDQYIHDIMNIVVAKASCKGRLSVFNTFASVFYTKEDDVEDNLLGKAFNTAGKDKDVDSSQYGAMLKASLNNGLGIDLRYVNTPASKGSVLDGGIVNALGGAKPFIISQGALHANLEVVLLKIG